MNDQAKVLPADSLEEQNLYLLVTPCEDCGSGPLEEVSRAQADSPSGTIDILEVRCTACHHQMSLRFGKPAAADPAAPSDLIDVGQWLGLCHHFLDLAQTNTNKDEAKHQVISARQYLNEALKFYLKGSDLPDESAFFGPLGDRRLKEHPVSFDKSKLLDLRRRLPAITSEISGTKPGRAKKKTKWWRNKS